MVHMRSAVHDGTEYYRDREADIRITNLPASSPAPCSVQRSQEAPIFRADTFLPSSGPFGIELGMVVSPYEEALALYPAAPIPSPAYQSSTLVPVQTDPLR